MASFVNNCSSSFAGFFVPMSNSDYSFLQLHQILPLGLGRNEEMLNYGRSAFQYSDGKGKWTFDQQKQYILFLHQNMEEMRQKSSRKSKKVFLKMSMKVKTRTPDQCRSHHQKILKYHQSLEQIIRHYTQVVYSFEKIFGFESSKGKKSIETLKTGLDQQISEDHKLWVEGNRVKIQINPDFIIDY